MRSDYWTVKMTGGGGQYNDPETYDIIDGAKRTIVKSECDKKLLQSVCDAHNKTLFA